MANTVSRRTLSVHKEHELLLKLESAGLDDADAQTVIESKNNELAQKIVVLIRCSDYEPALSVRKARAIMGKNFFGPEEWAHFLGIRFNSERLCDLGDLEFPWGENILNSPCPFSRTGTVAQTHFAFLGLPDINGEPLTIMRWHKLLPTDKLTFYYDHLCYRSRSGLWYGQERFATEMTCELKWYLLPLSPTPNPSLRTYKEQVAMLPRVYKDAEGYEVSTAVVEVTKYILYSIKNEPLYVEAWGQCQDPVTDHLHPNGAKVTVGCSKKCGIEIIRCDDTLKNIRIGLALLRKPLIVLAQDR